MDHSKEFEKLIKKDRDVHQARSWRGNLLDYLDKVKSDPSVAKLAHARVYDVLVKAGIRDIHENHDPKCAKAIQGRIDQALRFFRRRILRHRKNRVANCPLLSRRVVERRGEPPGFISNGTGGVGQKFAGGKTPSRPGIKLTVLRHRRLPDVRRTAAFNSPPLA